MAAMKMKSAKLTVGVRAADAADAKELCQRAKWQTLRDPVE